MRPMNDQSGTESTDRKSTRLNFSHLGISYAGFCLKKKIGGFHYNEFFRRFELAPYVLVHDDKTLRRVKRIGTQDAAERRCSIIPFS